MDDGFERNARGQFGPGNRGGPGGKRIANRTAELRSKLVACISDESVADAIDALAAKARTGDVSAIRELLDRAVGKPVALDVLQRLAVVEALVEAAEETNGGLQ